MDTQIKEVQEENQLVEVRDSRLVVKHNKLIEFRGQMTTNELKLLGLIIVNVREEQKKQFEEYHIDISALKDNTKHKDFYNYIKDVALRLEDKKIIVESINDENKRSFTTIRLINKPRYIEGSDKLVVNIDKDLIPYIINLKKEFTRYQIENILRLRSSYSVRIYELLKQYENIGVRDIDVKDLREYLGIEKNQYKRFYDFERRALKPAEEEINEHTDIIFTYVKLKKGRKIKTIRFFIEPKFVDEYKKLLDECYDIKDIKKAVGLENENFNSKQVMMLYEIAINKLGPLCESREDIGDYIRINYHVMLQKDNVINKYAYLKDMLEHDRASAIAVIRLKKAEESKSES